jgi:putative ABC transport system ATP-binding protein
MIELQCISKSFAMKQDAVHALCDVDLRLDAGEGIVIRGPSGSGKSTLLHMLGLMLRPSQGTIRLHGVDPWATSPRWRARQRRVGVGFVFQTGHLVPWLSLQANIMVAGAQPTQALHALEQVGLGHRAGHRPGRVSSGEAQRAAVARAMFGDPELVLADEPTGTLDDANGAVILDLLEQARQRGSTVVLATHGTAHQGAGWRTLHLADGRIVEPRETT